MVSHGSQIPTAIIMYLYFQQKNILNWIHAFDLVNYCDSESVYNSESTVVSHLVILESCHDIIKL